MKKQTVLLTLSLLAVSAAWAGGAGQPAVKPAAKCQSVGALIGNDATLSTLASTLVSSGLEIDLNKGSYTVFAPNDAAFAKMPSDQLAGLLNDSDQLQSVLKYHVVGGKITATQLGSLKNVKSSFDGQLLSVSKSGKQIGSAQIVRTIPACNGVVYVVNSVLMPKFAPVVAAPVPATSTVVVAPAQPATEPVAEQPATEPVVTEPAVAEPTVEVVTEPVAEEVTTEEVSEMPSNTVYDVIVADERFSTLRDLLSDAGLNETLLDGEYTILAPTNAAFEAFNQEQLAVIASDPVLLKEVLNYHIIKGKTDAAALASATELVSVQDRKITLRHDGDKVYLGDALVDVATPITTADNGVIYALDKLVLPEGLTIEAPAMAAATEVPTLANTATFLTTDLRFSTFAELAKLAGLLDSLNTTEYTVFLPTNAAFEKMDAAQLTALKADPVALKAFVEAYLVPGVVKAADLPSKPELTTVQGGKLLLKQDNGKYLIGEISIDPTTAVETSNGTLYIVDTLLPR